ncbi:MAG: outer membrane protein transport protein [Planctomycetes bacterium]|nr:outer membrane protein transport protein [Planctomycetota bacterium]
MPRITALLATAVAVIALAPPVWADGVVRDSIGATSSGRGGTNIAHFDNGAVLLDNPAGIINARSRGMFEVGVDGIITELGYGDPLNHVDNEFEASALPYVSVFGKSSDGRWAAGLGLFTPAGFGASWEQNAPAPIGGVRDYESFGVLVKLLPAVAYRVNDRLSVGGTVGVAFSEAQLNGPFFLQSGLLAGTPTVLDMEADGVAPTWSIGAQYLVSERTMVGLAYTSASRFTLEGKAQAQVYANLANPAVPIPSTFDVEADLAWPESVGIGLTHLVGCNQRFSMDLLWYNWSDAFDSIDLELSNPSQAAFVPLAPVRDSLPLEWNDSVSVRLGHKYFATCCDVFRVGYVYNSKTVPNSTLTTYIPATLEHTFTVGYGRTRNDWKFDAAYQFAFGPNQHVANSKLLGGDFDESVVSARTHWLMLSLAREF